MSKKQRRIFGAFGKKPYKHKASKNKAADKTRFNHILRFMLLFRRLMSFNRANCKFSILVFFYVFTPVFPFQMNVYSELNLPTKQPKAVFCLRLLSSCQVKIHNFINHKYTD